MEKINYTVTKAVLPLTGVKWCSCGRVYDAIPVGAKIVQNNDRFDGIYWDCPCRSTLVIMRQKALTSIKGAVCGA